MNDYTKENPWTKQIERLKSDVSEEDNQLEYRTNNPKYQSVDTSKLTRKMIPLSDNTLVAYLHGLRKVHKSIEERSMKQNDTIHVSTHHHYTTELLDEIIAMVDSEPIKQPNNKVNNLQELENTILLELNNILKHISILKTQSNTNPLDTYTNTVSLACLQSKVEAYNKVLETISNLQ